MNLFAQERHSNSEAHDPIHPDNSNMHTNDSTLDDQESFRNAVVEAFSAKLDRGIRGIQSRIDKMCTDTGKGFEHLEQGYDRVDVAVEHLAQGYERMGAVADKLGQGLQGPCTLR